jgi:hypothetical protein
VETPRQYIGSGSPDPWKKVREAHPIQESDHNGSSEAESEDDFNVQNLESRLYSASRFGGGRKTAGHFDASVIIAPVLLHL